MKKQQHSAHNVIACTAAGHGRANTGNGHTATTRTAFLCLRNSNSITCSGEARVFRVGGLLERPHRLRSEGPKAGVGFLGRWQPALSGLGAESRPPSGFSIF